MQKQKKIFYVLSAVLGITTLMSGTVSADYGNGRRHHAAQQQTDSGKDGSLFPGGSCPNCTNNRDGSLFPGGPCKSCTKDGSLFPGPCKKCKQRQEEKITPIHPLVKNYVPYTPVVYEAMQRNCCQMAPIALSNVDFRIKRYQEDSYTDRLGKYRFRIFGCRRDSKDAILNKGRVMEKDIAFNQVFEETVNDCYRVLSMPKDLCLQEQPTELPEYIVTAEVTDYYMNICDQYDWDNVKKEDARTGSSEMTITWRLMDLTKDKVYWSGETTGYGEVQEGEKDGEIKLIERAFADAVGNLRNMPGFEDTLMVRQTPIHMAAQRNALIEEERALNPAKCLYISEYECAKKCEISRPGADINALAQTCCATPCGCQQSCITPIQEPILESGNVDIINSCLDENGNVKADGNCLVVDDTWIDTGDAKDLDDFCVVDTDPCKELTPEAMHNLRAAVVQIESPNGRTGAGLLISDKFILTSADLIDKSKNEYTVKTVRNDSLKAKAVRINLSKNTALLMLEQGTNYTPLALNMKLPEVGRDGFFTLGMLGEKDFTNGEGYLENKAKIEGYRYTPERGAEILVNTFVQNVTVGGALIYKDCTINGMAHSGVRTDDGLDMFIPTETALRSLGIHICGHEYSTESPWQQTVYKPVSEQIKNVQKAPEAMKAKDRK